MKDKMRKCKSCDKMVNENQIKERAKPMSDIKDDKNWSGVMPPKQIFSNDSILELSGDVKPNIYSYGDLSDREWCDYCEGERISQSIRDKRKSGDPLNEWEIKWMEDNK